MCNRYGIAAGIHAVTRTHTGTPTIAMTGVLMASDAATGAAATLIGEEVTAGSGFEAGVRHRQGRRRIHSGDVTWTWASPSRSKGGGDPHVGGQIDTA